MALFSCSGSPPSDLGARDGRLAPCRSSPNCVSSDANDKTHFVDPFHSARPIDEAWNQILAAVAALPRTTLVKSTGDYLHAECRSAFFGFVDDLELHARPKENVIAVRSAARLGYSDFGVNRRRVERLRDLLRRQGVIR